MGGGVKVAFPGVDEDADFSKKGYAVKEDTVVALRQPGSFSDDPLTDILRAAARQLLAQAIEAEVEGHIAAHADLTDAQGPSPRCPSRLFARTRVTDGGSALSRSRRPGCVTMLRRAAASASRPQSCRLISGAANRWRRSCPGFT